MQTHSYDLIVVGTGFASSFFLRKYLEKAGPDIKVLVLERGKDHPYSWKIQNRANTDFNFNQSYVNLTPEKPWIQNVAFGGGSCWTGNTPRPHHSDFETNSLYGIAEDWPMSYDELEPFLLEAEQIMGIAGAETPFYRRSKPFPSSPHKMNAFDEAISKKYPGFYTPMPTARASQNTRTRPSCCGNGECATCPITAKFQIDLHMRDLYQDPRVELQLESNVIALDIENQIVTGVIYEQGSEQKVAKCDLAAIGAHAITTPFIMLNSGLGGHALGRYLNEQLSVAVKIDLDGVDNYGGSQSVSGLGLMFYDGDFRRERPGCLIESWNIPWLRAEKGKWRQRALIKFVFEDNPQYENYVTVSKDRPNTPEVFYGDHSDYMKAGIASVPKLMEEFSNGLPIENYTIIEEEGLGTDAHIQGTIRMGNDPDKNVLDKHLKHHEVRNLIGLGSGVFPNCPAANPTLILSALSLWAANHL